VEVAVDEGIGRDLVGSTPGDENGPSLARAAAEAPGCLCPARPTVEARWRTHTSLAGVSLAVRESPQAGSGMAAVEDDRQIHALGEVFHEGVEVVVGEGIVPVEIVRTDDLVESVALVALAIADLRPVARVVEHEDVACPSAVQQPVQAVDDRRRGGLGVGEALEAAARGEAEVRGQQVADLPDVPAACSPDPGSD
jgi:hypothetical protein